MTEVTGGLAGGILMSVRRYPEPSYPLGNRTARAETRDSGTLRRKGLTRMNGSTTVSTELGLRLVVPEHTAVPLLASLSYHGDDPYAIRMAFHVGMDEPVEWIFARDLLIAGTQQLTGDGDVQVWPAAGSEGEVLNIALSSPFGQALFEAPAPVVGDFLKRTYVLVPAGREDDFVDIENE